MRNIQIIPLDRIIKVARDDKGRFIENTFMDPETYLDEMIGVTRDLKSRTKLITLKVDANQAPYLLTKPLHPSQQLVTEQPDGSITIQLNVIHNLELERCILGFGHHIEVIAPKPLRHSIGRHILMAATKYSNNAPLQ